MISLRGTTGPLWEGLISQAVSTPLPPVDSFDLDSRSPDAAPPVEVLRAAVQDEDDRGELMHGTYHRGAPSSALGGMEVKPQDDTKSKWLPVVEERTEGKQQMQRFHPCLPMDDAISAGHDRFHAVPVNSDRSRVESTQERWLPAVEEGVREPAFFPVQLPLEEASTTGTRWLPFVEEGSDVRAEGRFHAVPDLASDGMEPAPFPTELPSDDTSITGTIWLPVGDDTISGGGGHLSASTWAVPGATSRTIASGSAEQGTQGSSNQPFKKADAMKLMQGLTPGQLPPPSSSLPAGDSAHLRTPGRETPPQVQNVAGLVNPPSDAPNSGAHPQGFPKRQAAAVLKAVTAFGNVLPPSSQTFAGGSSGSTNLAASDLNPLVHDHVQPAIATDLPGFDSLSPSVSPMRSVLPMRQAVTAMRTIKGLGGAVPSNTANASKAGLSDGAFDPVTPAFDPSAPAVNLAPPSLGLSQSVANPLPGSSGLAAFDPVTSPFNPSTLVSGPATPAAVGFGTPTRPPAHPGSSGLAASDPVTSPFNPSTLVPGPATPPAVGLGTPTRPPTHPGQQPSHQPTHPPAPSSNFSAAARRVAGGVNATPALSGFGPASAGSAAKPSTPSSNPIFTPNQPLHPVADPSAVAVGSSLPVADFPSDHNGISSGGSLTTAAFPAGQGLAALKAAKALRSKGASPPSQGNVPSAPPVPLDVQPPAPGPSTTPAGFPGAQAMAALRATVAAPLGPEPAVPGTPGTAAASGHPDPSTAGELSSTLPSRPKKNQILPAGKAKKKLAVAMAMGAFSQGGQVSPPASTDAVPPPPGVLDPAPPSYVGHKPPISEPPRVRPSFTEGQPGFLATPRSLRKSPLSHRPRSKPAGLGGSLGAKSERGRRGWSADRMMNLVHTAGPAKPVLKDRPITSRGLVATKDEARDSYNAIDGNVADGLTTTVQSFVHSCERVSMQEATGVYLVLERCHSCSIHHKLSTRHNEHQYKALAQDLLANLRMNTQGLVMDMCEMPCHLEANHKRLGGGLACGQEVWHHSSRVGAFELYLLTPNVCTHGLTTATYTRSDTQDNDNDPKISWGAQQLLQGCGYNVTLLHSKLSSKSWPTIEQVTKRLLQTMPGVVLDMSVFDPSGSHMPRFTVELVRVDVPDVASDTGGLGSSKAEGEHMVVQGSRGRCVVEGVPLQANLQLRIYHSSMRMQTVDLVTTRLRLEFVFGADIVFRLWAIEVPGGLAVWASIDDLDTSRLPERSRPFSGELGLRNGQSVEVSGRVQVPWESFQPGLVEPAFAFAKLGQLRASGYKSADVPARLASFTMKQLQQEELLEIATLAAPEVSLQIVLPGSCYPLADVHVEIAAEQQSAVTDRMGHCMVVLREGVHEVQLMHEVFTGTWVKQLLTVDVRCLRMQVPLPVRLAVWQAPVMVCKETCAHKLWLTAIGEKDRVLPSWVPFQGSLQSGDGSVLQVTNGAFAVEAGSCKALDGEPNQTAQPTIMAEPLAGLSPMPPFYVLAGALATGVITGEEARHAEVVDVKAPIYAIMAERCGALFLGTCLKQAAMPSAVGEMSSSQVTFVACARTTCCGQGVPRVKLVVDQAHSGNTDEHGAWAAHGLEPGNHVVEAEHPSLLKSPETHILHLSRLITRPELPLFIKPLLYVFTVMSDQGRELVQVAAREDAVPAQAAPFPGRITDGNGSQLKPERSFMGGVQPVRLQASEAGAVANDIPTCPASVTLVPEATNFHWFPVKPWPLGSEGCHVQHLLQCTEALTLGYLRPFATAVAWHQGKRHDFELPIERYPTTAAAAAYIIETLNAETCAPVVLASPGEAGDAGMEPEVLGPEHPLLLGTKLHALAQCELRIMLGTQSDVEISDALVVLGDAASRAGTAIKAKNDRYPLAVHAGDHRVTVTHPALGPEPRIVTLCLQSLRSVWTFFARAQVIIYSTQLPGANLQVWFCAHQGLVPADAQPVEGTLRVRGYGFDDVREVTVSGMAIEAIPVEEDEGNLENVEESTTEVTARTPLRLPAAGVTFACHEGDRIWTPTSRPWLLETADEWLSILNKPICAGLLKAPVMVRCHGCRGGTSDAAELVKISLPADLHGTMAEVCTAVSPQVSIPASDFVVFRREKQQELEAAVEPFDAIDLWPLALMDVRVCVRCCFSSVEGATLEARQDYTMAGTEATPGEMNEGSAHFVGETDSKGQCQLTVNTGTHTLHLRHPLMQAIDKDGSLAQRKVQAQHGQPQHQDFVIDTAVFIFMLPVSGLNFSVWACVHQTDIPENALAVPGTLCVPTAEGLQRLPLQGPRERLGLPRGREIGKGKEASNNNVACPMAQLSIHVGSGSELMWAPHEEKNGNLSQSTVTCGHLQLAKGSVQIGSLRRVFNLRLEGQQEQREIQMPMDELAGMEGVFQRAAEELAKPRDEFAIFTLDGARCSDNFQPQPGQVLIADLLASLTIRVVVPESAVGDTSLHGLQGAEVTVGGLLAGKTDGHGTCCVVSRVGSCSVTVQHPCLGENGRTKESVPVEYGRRNECLVFADVCVYVFASFVDDDSEEDSSQGEVEDHPAKETAAIRPIVVSMGASKDQIPENCVSVAGVIAGIGESGKEVRQTFASEGPTEFVLLAGEATGTSQESRCSLSSVQVHASKPGFSWRSREPSPLVERAQDMGGCEYLRLLDIPVIIGYLEPAFLVESGKSEPQWLPASTCGTVKEAKRYLQRGSDIPLQDMALYSGEIELEDDARLKVGDKIQLLQLAPVQLQVVSGCCEEPLHGVDVIIDGKPRGTTDLFGSVGGLSLRVGTHKVVLRHSSLGGTHDGCSQSFTVEPGLPNAFALKTGSWLYLYGTELEEETESGEAVGTGGTSPAAARAHDQPHTAASRLMCVWLSADARHVADDGLPLHGLVTCRTAHGVEASGAMTGTTISPLVFNLGAGKGFETEGLVIEKAKEQKDIQRRATTACCPLATLELTCTRPGQEGRLCWCPKEPSPLMERTMEIGGCELQRILSCEVSLGFLKPALKVYCADGEQLAIPLDAISDISGLKTYVARSIGQARPNDLVLEIVEGSGASRPVESADLRCAVRMLCAAPGQQISKAHETLVEAEATGVPNAGSGTAAA